MAAAHHEDRALLLRDPKAVQQRLAQIEAPHVAPLNAFVRCLRETQPADAFIPYFDPWDGGTKAKCLFLLEAPGNWAKKSGFASLNNGSQTARNLFEGCGAAGIDRTRIAWWNVVPWYIGDGSRIRQSRAGDIRAGLPHLIEVLGLLPRLRVIVYFGGAALKARGGIEAAFPAMEAVECIHPSNVAMNQKPGNRELLLRTLRTVAKKLDKAPMGKKAGPR